MAEISPRRLRVAAVQMHCEPGASEHNLRRGAELVAQAVAQSAELVLLPELMPGGYSLTEANWDSAETMRGDSVAWLKAEAKRHSIYLGFSFLEADGDDFYNSFVLAEMGEEEGVIVAEVTLDPARRKTGMPRRYGSMWAFPVPWYAFTWPMSQRPGEKANAASLQRAAKAREKSRDH